MIDRPFMILFINLLVVFLLMIAVFYLFKKIIHNSTNMIQSKERLRQEIHEMSIKTFSADLLKSMKAKDLLIITTILLVFTLRWIFS